MDISDNLSVESKTLKVNVYTSLVALSVLLVSWIVMSQSLKLKAFGKKIDKIPGPFSIPILGTLVLIIIPRSEILEVIIRWTRKFKDGCFRLWLLNEPVIFISSPDHVQKILGSKEHLEKAALYQVLKPLIGNGLITADVPSWKAHRRLLINSVNGKMVNIFMGVCNQTLHTFHDILSKESSIVNFNEQPTQQTNLHPFINRLAFDIICETIFGISKETLKNSSTYYLEISHKNKTVMSNRWFSPWLRWNWVWAVHPLKRYEEDINAATQELFDYGHDTSSETMLWASFMLGNHPELQDKVHDEMKEIFGDNRTPEITLDDLSRMTYLDQCIKETLRVYPSVPLLLEEGEHDVELEPDLIIPARVRVRSCLLHSSNSPEPSVYKNQRNFDPERFAADKIADIHPYGYCPFSLGPRNCIGKSLEKF
ncbi:Cytochrome P450 4C1 [Orchesella cincta]|uniref:Cytochrome P450 4C1 n=1 Tax=Orchesella cincta TaxID=48709 RepID=A0A1D2MKN4_ORCCI|nr:Cytochrome P450 4C1 [Orchesella cincta]